MSLRVAEEDSHITIFSKVDGLNADENAERVFIGYQMQTERGIAEPRLSLTDSAGDEALRLTSWGIQTFAGDETEAATEPPMPMLRQINLHADDLNDETKKNRKPLGNTAMTDKEIEQAVNNILSYDNDKAATDFFRIIRAIFNGERFEKDNICYSAMQYSYRKTRHCNDAMTELMEGREQ